MILAVAIESYLLYEWCCIRYYFLKKYCSPISGDTAAYQTVLALEKKMVVAV